MDKHAALLRLSCASSSNDRRLGGDEAPPAIISMFLGDDLMDVIEKVKSNVEQPERAQALRFGVPTLPEVYRDATDRNRTSPFAFTGNKFEFRMPGASQSLSECNTVLNTIVADALREFADYRMLVYSIVLILVMLATHNPTLQSFFARLKPGKKEEKEAA